MSARPDAARGHPARRGGHVWAGDDGGGEHSGASILSVDGAIARVGNPGPDWPATDRVFDATDCADARSIRRRTYEPEC